MCGIYGSTNYNRFKELHELNVTRGNFATGHLFINSNGEYEIERFPGENNYHKYPTTEQVGQYDMYMGHTQSPTGSVRDFDFSTSHPFENNNWVVAHNGVINNYRELITTYLPEWRCDVDSSIITALLNYLCQDKTIKGNHELMENIVRTTLDKISGTYAVFIYDKLNRDTYIARSGSTLYFDRDHLEFSSVDSDNLEQLPQYELFKSRDQRYEHVSSLKNNSSFIIF
jgi:glucosamine 6-phosphate synthetase-like amidotransferase/phosphosugar isomerase protein